MIDGDILRGHFVRLEPLSMHHSADLAISAEEDRSQYGFTWVPRASDIEDYLEVQLRRRQTDTFRSDTCCRWSRCGLHGLP